jgi:hypothetical protein
MTALDPQQTSRHRRAPYAPRPPNNRASTSPKGTSRAARRLYDITSQMIQDEGGLNKITETQLSLIRSFASLCVLREALDARIAKGEAINTASYAKICSIQVRVATRIAARRAKRKVDRAMQTLRRRADAAKRRSAEREPLPTATPSPFGDISPEGSIDAG